MMNATFSSHRPVVMGTNWMITSGHPLASQAGASILDKGGNALDAAIAANAVLGVVRPHMCGIGGDAF
ncbi:MAG: gamma-glutamyltransferase, partial [Thermodesulfobacteriota bacterium]